MKGESSVNAFKITGELTYCEAGGGSFEGLAFFPSHLQTIGGERGLTFTLIGDDWGLAKYFEFKYD